MGAISKLYRIAKNSAQAAVKPLKSFLSEKLHREKSENDDEVPLAWVKRQKADVAQEKANPKKVKTEIYLQKGKLVVKGNKVQVPWLKRVKRYIAGLLLFFNMVFSQFLLGFSTEGKILFLLFIGNSFILADYLWKTRRVDQ